MTGDVSIRDYEVEDTQDPDLPKPFEYDEWAENLVTEFVGRELGDEALSKLRKFMLDTYDQAWASMDAYRSRAAAEWKLFSGDLPEKDWPFDKCANVHVPIMLENLTRLVFRGIGEVFGDWKNVFGVMPVGPDDEEEAEYLSLHGNWQIREDIPDFRPQMHRAMLLYYMAGDVISHSSFDPVRRQNRHEVLTCEEFFLPYSYVSVMPDLSDLPYYGRIHTYYDHELEAMSGTWEGIDKILRKHPPDFGYEPEQPLAESVAETMKIEIPDGSDTSGAPHKVIQWFGWVDLPDQDGKRWVEAYIHYASQTIMQLSIHEAPNWKEQERYALQVEERNRYAVARQSYEAAIGQAAEMGVDPEAAGVVAPAMPDWMDPNQPELDPEPMRRDPIHMFAHGVCIEPLRGNLGMGFGRIQSDFNLAANTLACQFVDSATFANVGGYFYSGPLKFPEGMSLAPGSFTRVDGVSGTELRDNLVKKDFQPANPQMMEILNHIVDWAQSSMQSPNVLSGEAGKSGETFRGLATRVEQAAKQLSVATSKFATPFLAQVLRNNARLNAIHLPPHELKMINDHRVGRAVEVPISRDMYRRNYSVYFTSDMKFTSDAQRVADAQELVMMSAQDPFLQQNVAFAWEARRRLLEAKGLHQMVALLGPKPPPPTTPMGLQQQPMPQQPGASPPGANGPAGPAPEGPPQ